MDKIETGAIRIELNNVILRDFRPADLIQYQQLRSDPKMHRFYSEDDSSEQRAGQLLQMFIEQADSLPRTKFQFALESGGELVGTCGIRLESPGDASIGCEIGRQWQWSGLARKAAAGILEFGFGTLCVERIYAETISDNRAAIKLCNAVGMTVTAERIGDRTFKGRTWNTTTMSISREAWDGKRA
ncbi:GNAT family protein [Caballeronia sp. LjRoot29]|uniref:GNAT family N-acetyltransferase n=1 Tax=Caballeronia sp. LjRoot29 TaxID=3342315 RepID=UPI003ECC9ADA